jgi:hypothetical protein
VINCAAKKDEIMVALQRVTEASFQEKLVNLKSPYEKEGTSSLIVAAIEEVLSQKISAKKFYDL